MCVGGGGGILCESDVPIVILNVSDLYMPSDAAGVTSWRLLLKCVNVKTCENSMQSISCQTFDFFNL